MSRFSTLLSRVAVAAMLASLLVLAGCNRGGVKSSTVDQGKFDTTVQAYKTGQFLLGGAVLSAIDLGSHFAYLKDQGQLPKTVLLEPSDESKVRKQHLQYMARMQLDYGFKVYYENGGKLTEINPQDTKARRLEDVRAPVQMNDQQRGKDAAGSSIEDRARGY